MDGSREDATVRWSPSPCRRSRLDLNYTALFLPADRPINLLQRQQQRRLHASSTKTASQVDLHQDNGTQPITQATATRSTLAIRLGSWSLSVRGSNSMSDSKRSAFGRDEYLYLVAVPYSIVATVTTSLAVVS